MTQEKKISKTPQKKEKELNGGPPKFFNSKNASKDSQASEKLSEKSSESSAASSIGKKSTQEIQKKNAPKSKKNSKDNKNTQKATKNNEEAKNQQIRASRKETQKHANNFGSETQEEEKVVPEDFASRAMQAQNLPQMNMGGANYGYQMPHTANPQCGYNQQYNATDDPQYMQFLYEIYIYQKLTAEIDQETKQITIMVNMIQKYRQAIKARIENIAVSTFEGSHSNVQAHVYGSVATELALPESDMDIMITGINSFGNKEAHKENISTLHQKIKDAFDEDIMVKCNKILNTQVPIIKLTFNLAKYFDTFSSEDSRLPFINFDSINSINPHLKELSVDISVSDSFNTSGHLGLTQNNFVREKLELYPVLRPVCLILKKLLVKNDFNDPYTGGLGSFGLFLMLYAALCFEQTNTNEMFHCESTYKARLLIYFLSMYGENFDIEKKLIFFSEDGFPMLFDKIGQSPSGSNKILCVYDPTNIKNNTTQKAFRIEEIQRLFKDTKQKVLCSGSETVQNAPAGY